MTIRAHLTLWYALVLFVSALVIGAVGYHEFVVEPRAGHREHEPPGKSPSVDEADEESEAWSELLRVALFFGLPAALLGLAGGWFLMRKALAPVARLTAAAGRITEHNLEETLPRSGHGDELDRLTEVFNAMTARLHGSFQRIREFTLHASHELKTPLTVLHGELEAAIQDPGLPPVHRERCETQLAEVQRLGQIVDGLTLLTKADAGLVALARKALRLDELVQDAFADTQILAQPGGIEVRLEACEPSTVCGDRNRLRQLLLNLTDNAIKYNHSGGQVILSLGRSGGRAELTLANTGPGIPAGLQDRVFERFFRGDPSHSNDVEGCGLGLSTAQWIVSAHGGEIRLVSEPPGWTVVTVRLPLSTSPEGAPPN
ncbi:MAG: HAMP domain-containing protein [Verrucomicrobiales bacterium]|nr:HAMP domain-containing protein [Verrucomicrobiales bacterium]